MKPAISAILGLSFVLSAAVRSAAPAFADGTPLTVCNQTSSTIDVTVAYHTAGPNDTDGLLTGPFDSAGWWVIQPGTCTPIPNPFAARYMFWAGFVEHGGWFWSDSDYYFCVPNTTGSSTPQFTFDDQNVSESACESSAPYDSSGPNMWVASHENDMDVNSTVYYNGQ